MPYGYVSAGAAVVGALGSLSAGGSGNSPSLAGWETNAMALTDMMGTSNPDTSNPYNVYSPQYQYQTQEAQGLQGQAAGMADEFNAGAQQLSNQQGALSGQITGASNAYLNSGNQGQYQQAMNALVPGYQNIGGSALGLGNQLAGQVAQAQGYGNMVMQTAFDPQQALYNQQYQLQQQQTDANQAARGLSMSPVGAELSNQADQNFNIGWQNNQLQRQTAGLSAYDTNNASIGSLAQGANQAYSQGMQDYSTAAQIPYNTAQTIYNNNQAAYGNQQAAMTAAQAAYLQQQQTAQQGFSNQANALTGSQQALTNQVNNFNAGNTWYGQQEANLMGYYNGSAPSQFGNPQATTANGYAGLGNFLGSSAFQNAAMNGAIAYNAPTAGSSYSPGGASTYTSTGGTGMIATPTMSYSDSLYSIPGSTAYSAAANTTADAAGFAALGG